MTDVSLPAVRYWAYFQLKYLHFTGAGSSVGKGGGRKDRNVLVLSVSSLGQPGGATGEFSSPGSAFCVEANSQVERTSK